MLREVYPTNDSGLQTRSRTRSVAWSCDRATASCRVSPFGKLTPAKVLTIAPSSRLSFSPGHGVRNCHRSPNLVDPLDILTGHIFKLETLRLASSPRAFIDSPHHPSDYPRIMDLQGEQARLDPVSLYTWKGVSQHGCETQITRV